MFFKTSISSIDCNFQVIVFRYEGVDDDHDDDTDSAGGDSGDDDG